MGAKIKFTCEACGATHSGSHTCPPGTPRLSRTVQEKTVWDEAAEALVEQWMEQNFERFAENWWAKRLRDGQWQEEQDILEELWAVGVRDGDDLRNKTGYIITTPWPRGGYLKSSAAPQETRTYAWIYDVLRGKEVWRRVYDE